MTSKTITQCSASPIPGWREGTGSLFKQAESLGCCCGQTQLSHWHGHLGEERLFWLVPAIRAESLSSTESFIGGLGTCCALCLEFSSPEAVGSSLPPPPHLLEFSSGHASSEGPRLTDAHPEIHQLMDGPHTRELHHVAIATVVILYLFVWIFFSF